MRRQLRLALVLVGTAGCAGGRSGVAPVRSGTIAMNSQVSGVLTRRDALLSNNTVYQWWTFYGTAGQYVQVDMMSTDFDAYLMLQYANGELAGRDDDSGGGLNARIGMTLSVTGSYRVIASARYPNTYGSYTVRLTSAGTAPVGGGGVMAGTVGTIVRGQVVSGRLTLSDARLSDSSLYQAWAFMGRGGEPITVDVMSTDFDAYCIVQDGNGNQLASDDDSGEGLNARLTLTLPYSGMYRIIANTYRQRASGGYTMALRGYRRIKLNIRAFRWYIHGHGRCARGCSHPEGS